LRRWQASRDRKVLNLGGGGNCLVGCLTVDIDPRADCFVDLRKDLPFANDSIDAIFCEEAVEHISKSECERLLKECHRILRPEGVLRITTPNLDYLAGRVNEDRAGPKKLDRVISDRTAPL
jgi:predicted SAM-dependent methyltransferase